MLKNVPVVAPKPASIDKVPNSQKELVKSIQKILDELAVSQNQNKIMGDSRQADIILMRIASLLESFKVNEQSEALEKAKDEIIKKVESLEKDGFISKLLEEYLAKQLVNLFDEPATKEDIEELKSFLIQIKEETPNEDRSKSSEKPLETAETSEKKFSSEEAQPQEDNEEGLYLDSTPAKNFFTLQTFIGQQFESLNATIAKMTTPKITPSVARKSNKMMAFFGKISENVKKVFGFLQKIIQPAIDFVKRIIMKFVVAPILLITVKIGLIIAAIALIVAGITLLVLWVKDKILEFWNYVKSGKLWEDIKAGMLKAWEWTADFGKWLWDTILDALEYIFVDMWVDLGEWVWEKLCDFGKWLYDNYIDKYLVQPFKTHIWEPVKKLWNEKIWSKIEPFIDSLTELKDNIVKAFSAWDVNKSIWDNLKNIGGILKDVIVNWWDNSPFKTFYEQNIKPFVVSAKDLFNRLENLGGFIKDAIVSWWNGDSSLGDTLKNIGSKVWDTIVEWWNKSIFKKYWEKLKVYLDDLLKPLRDWWKESWLGKTFQKGWESLKEKWDEFKKVWDDFSFKEALTSWWDQSTLKSWIETIKGWVNDVVNAVSNFGTTIKDSVVSWWNESDLKKWVDKFTDLGKTIKDAIVKWYDESLKEWIEKIKNFGKTIKDSVVSWWNESDLKKWIDTIKAKIEEFKQRLGKIIIKLPMMGYIRLFGPAVGLPMKVSDEDAAEIDKENEYQKQLEKFNKLQQELADITAGRRDDSGMFTTSNSKRKKQIESELAKMNFTPRQEAQDKAQQVVEAQMKPLQEMEQSKAEANASVDESFASVAKARQLEQERQQEQQDYSINQQTEMFQFMKDMRGEMKNGFANPQVVPAPIMITNNNGPNPAMMENR